MGEEHVELISSPWADRFRFFATEARDELLVASPYLTGHPLDTIVQVALEKEEHARPRVGILTNLDLDNILTGGVDVASLLKFVEQLPNTGITYLPGLHAKVYVTDTTMAIITSSNLTTAGLHRNQEYGVLLRDPATVLKIREHLIKLASLGNIVPLEALSVIAAAVQDLLEIRRRTERSARRKLREMFAERARNTRLELLKVRARQMTTHGIFCRTVLYLLEEKGPLPTRQLHPLVQQIHPDLCDDTIDRVIDGVHFGKRWKHYVRNAQQALKREGQIKLENGRWTLCQPVSSGYWESLVR